MSDAQHNNTDLVANLVSDPAWPTFVTKIHDIIKAFKQKSELLTHHALQDFSMENNGFTLKQTGDLIVVGSTAPERPIFQIHDATGQMSVSGNYLGSFYSANAGIDRNNRSVMATLENITRLAVKDELAKTAEEIAGGALNTPEAEEAGGTLEAIDLSELLKKEPMWDVVRSAIIQQVEHYSELRSASGWCITAVGYYLRNEGGQITLFTKAPEQVLLVINKTTGGMRLGANWLKSYHEEVVEPCGHHISRILAFLAELVNQVMAGNVTYTTEQDLHEPALPEDGTDLGQDVAVDPEAQIEEASAIQFTSPKTAILKHAEKIDRHPLVQFVMGGVHQGMSDNGIFMEMTSEAVGFVRNGKYLGSVSRVGDFDEIDLSLLPDMADAMATISKQLYSPFIIPPVPVTPDGLATFRDTMFASLLSELGNVAREKKLDLEERHQFQAGIRGHKLLVEPGSVTLVARDLTEVFRYDFSAQTINADDSAVALWTKRGRSFYNVISSVLRYVIADLRGAVIAEEWVSDLETLVENYRLQWTLGHRAIHGEHAELTADGELTLSDSGGLIILRKSASRLFIAPVALQGSPEHTLVEATQALLVKLDHGVLNGDDTMGEDGGHGAYETVSPRGIPLVEPVAPRQSPVRAFGEAEVHIPGTSMGGENAELLNVLSGGRQKKFSKLRTRFNAEIAKLDRVRVILDNEGTSNYSIVEVWKEIYTPLVVKAGKVEKTLKWLGMYSNNLVIWSIAYDGARKQFLIQPTFQSDEE
jgi:hypothetical protein